MKPRQTDSGALSVIPCTRQSRIPFVRRQESSPVGVGMEIRKCDRAVALTITTALRNSERFSSCFRFDYIYLAGRQSRRHHVFQFQPRGLIDHGQDGRPRQVHGGNSQQ